MKKYLLFYFIVCISIQVFAQSSDVFEIARNGTVLQMQEFIGKHSESVNSINPGGSSPLILAAYYGNEGTALLLSDKVKDINYNSGRGTALMAAVMNGNLTIIKKLISVNADLNASDNEGKTALMYAVYFNKNEIAKVLIDKGANKSLKDKEGKTALDVARFNKNTTLSILLDQ